MAFEVMKISLLQLPNSKYVHIVYVSIIASLLLGAVLAPSLLRAAAQDDDARVLEVLCNSYGGGVNVNREGRSERLSFGDWLADQRPELVDLFNDVGCQGISASVSGGVVRGSASIATSSVGVLDNRFIDLDGDGSDDVRIQHLTLLQAFSGVIDGDAVATTVARTNLNTNVAITQLTVIFTGTVGDSDPGTMTFFNTVVSDRSDPANHVFKGRIVVLEGSGHDGLEGICGGGTTLGQGPAGGPFAASSSFAFTFGDNCHNFNPFES